MRASWRNVLARWCVSDPTGTWTPIKSVDDFTVCDETPSEARGTYSFEAAELMRRPELFLPQGIENWWGPDDPVTHWTRFCQSADQDLCVVRRDVVDSDGAMAASLVLRSRQGSDEYTVQARLPNGGLLHEPTTWQIDQHNTFKVEYHYCQAEWCVVQAKAGGAGVDSFKRGNQVMIATRDRSNQPHR